MKSRNENGAGMSLADVIRLTLGHFPLLLGAFFGFAVVAAAVSLLLPDIYLGEALIAPAENEQNTGIQLGGLEGLAGLAGISLPTSADTDQNLAVLRSRDFIWRFIREYDLMPVLFSEEWDASKEQWIAADPDEQPNLWDAYRLFTRKIFQVTKQPNTSLVRVSIEWYDPEVAALWANQIIELLNRYLRSKAIETSTKNLEYLNEELEGVKVAGMRLTLYQLIEKEQRTAMVVNTQKEYAFRVLDPAVAPDKKVRPKRALLTLLAGVLGVLLAMVYVVVRYGDRNDAVAGD
jgi:uncharacterized protein involved in exopolysaccharide biosynthesis